MEDGTKRISAQGYIIKIYKPDANGNFPGWNREKAHSARCFPSASEAILDDGIAEASLRIMQDPRATQMVSPYEARSYVRQRFAWCILHEIKKSKQETILIGIIAGHTETSTMDKHPSDESSEGDFKATLTDSFEIAVFEFRFEMYPATPRRAVAVVTGKTQAAVEACEARLGRRYVI